MNLVNDNPEAKRPKCLNWNISIQFGFTEILFSKQTKPSRLKIVKIKTEPN